MLNLATTSLAGLGPARTGGASTDYLSADGTYSVPPVGSAATLTKSITVEDPAADENITMFFTTVAITVTQLSAIIQGATSVTYNIQWADTRNASDDSVMDSNLEVDSTTGGAITTSFGTGDAIPANSWVWLTTHALSDTPTEFHVTIEYTED
jgi:hypothetical protein